MTEYWGPYYWYFLHTISKSYPEHPTQLDKKLYSELFLLFIKLLPCKSCQAHFIAITKAHPAKMNNRDEWEHWVVKIHNKVNMRSKKPKISYDAYMTMYQTIDHEILYKFINYVQKRAYMNHIPFSQFIYLLNLLVLLYPCLECRRSYQYRYKKDNLPQLMLSRVNLEHWLKTYIKPKEYHIKFNKLKLKVKKHKKKHKNKNKPKLY